ncbi:MAG: M23 family metallopeptidase [Anaerovoracaceae bacterium]
MREINKKRDKVAIALVLSFCVVALTSVFAVKASLDKFNSENVQISEEMKTQSQNKAQKDAVVSKPAPVVDSKKPTKQTAADYIAPIQGEILSPYSMDMPIYSKTLDQYMTHSGVDIASPLSSQVKAIAGGNITNILKDDKYGTVVEINHGNGIISLYGNLTEDSMVEEGDVVKQGDIIGAIGETALFENGDVAHLHLEMTKNSAYVNPQEYIKGL